MHSVVCRRSLLAAVMLACLAGPALADPASDRRVADVARLWSTLKYIHPALADGRVDWDRALVDALPALTAAEDGPALRAAVARLVAPLADPALRIHDGQGAELVQWPSGAPALEWLPGDVALFHLHTPGPTDLGDIDKARRLIIDLRPASRSRDMGWEAALHALLARLIDKPLLLPAQRYRLASGPRPVIPSWEGLPSAFLTIEADRIEPAAGKARPLIFIVNDSEAVPRAVLAMQRAGLARIVAEQGAFRVRSGPLERVDMSGMQVEFSSGELALPEGRVDLVPDAMLAMDRATGANSKPVQAALKLFNRKTAPPRSGAPLAFAVRQDEPHYPEMIYPGRYWRMLAAIKLWSVMDRHFPAKRLMSSSWDDALRVCLGRMRSATDALGYARALEEMAAKLDDSHVRVFSRALRDEQGRARAGLRIDHVEGRYIITGFRDADLADSGARVGDEVLALDGEDFAVRVTRLAPQVAASTAAGKVRNAIARALLGTPDSMALLSLRDADGVRTVQVRRTAPEADLPARATRPVVQVLDGGIGYVDLDRLTRQDVDGMFKSIERTSAVIFDMRGYPQRTAHYIAPRLNVNGATTGAVSYQNLVMPLALGSGVRMAYSSTFRPSTAPLYRGKVVMLVNEHTQSQAEDLAMNVAAVAPVTFVGTPSAGADGDVRQVNLPGKVTVSYSGYEVTHADGRQLQRVGIKPHVLVAPTVQGIRAGRDEVLERALEHLMASAGG